MAISADNPGFEVTIEVEGTALREFDHEPSTSTTDQPVDQFANAITKYLEAPSGSEFVIRYTYKPPFNPTFLVHAEVTLDGQLMLAPDNTIDFKDGNESWTCSSTTYTVDNQAFAQKFRFAELDIEEGNLSAVSKDVEQRLNSLGKISLKFWDVESTQNQSHYEVPQQHLDSIGTLSEKAVKKTGLTHQAGLNAPQEKTDPYYSIIETVGSHPFATFIFEYRSTDALKNMHIIPRTPSPSPSPSPTPTLPLELPATATNEELREFVRRLQERVETQRMVKREREEEVGRVAGEREYEGEVFCLGSRAVKRVRRGPGEGDLVVDLGIE